MNDWLILTDEMDNEIGYAEKMDVHVRELLHRAFSLFIYNEKEQKMLLHRRAIGKYHSENLWTNACCSHPRKGEKLLDAVIRRVREELGIDISCFKEHLEEVGKFEYYEKYPECAEYEIDHVFLLRVKECVIVYPDKSEISEIMWIDIPSLKKWLSDTPDTFTAWFSRAFDMVSGMM